MNLAKALRKFAPVLLILFVMSSALAMPLLKSPITLLPSPSPSPQDTAKVKPQAQPLSKGGNDTIPDSLLNTRWKIQRTQPIELSDLDRNGTDLKMPEGLKTNTVFNDTIGYYVLSQKFGHGTLATPIFLTPEEYTRWSQTQMLRDFFRKKNADAYEAQGKEKFDFSDMHFDLGPAEKIFGPGGVRIKTQGSAEVKFGLNIKSIDNPSLPVHRRKTTNINFDEKVNMNLTGKVGDKVNLGLNYNTEATMNFDTQNLKLKYDGKEDEIIKLVEAGNVSFPSNVSLVRGASALFGLRTDMQFGKLKLQTVVSQKKSNSSSVSSKGGSQFTTFEIDAADYEENRHFFLAQYFRDKYDAAMKTLPNITTGINISRVEVWITNKTGNTNNTRSIVAFTDLGENRRVSNTNWAVGGMPVPANTANDLYMQMVNAYADARDIDLTSTVLDGIPSFAGGSDYEKLESARLLTSSEYTVNKYLGYISLRTALQPDQVLAVAFEYTYGGQTFQVGEFASDITDVSKALYVKALKNTSNNPQQGNWDLMMKNVYYLADRMEKTKFRLDVKFQSDTAGVYLSYLPEPQVKDQPLIKFLGADRLDNNNKAHSNGYFDYVEGYTVSNGRVFFPSAEPFGQYILDALVAKGIDVEKAQKYAFTELYDSTKTVAKQIAEKDKYMLVGQFQGSAANVISLGAMNVPQGSVVVTAGGMTLTEGSDYTVDYSAGEVTILNQSIIDAGTPVNVSCESNTDWGQQRKTMFGVNWEYDFSKNFQMNGTLQHLSEQTLTSKVSMGAEPLNNTIWGVGLNWKKESQWLTNMLNKVPFLHVTQPSQISFSGEFAQLIAGQGRGTQDNASYLDDFENTKSTIDVSRPTDWVLSSVPSTFPESQDKQTLSSGFNRSTLAWYTIDPLFTRRSSSLTPSHIKSDLDQLSNHYVREVPVRELYPNRDQSSYTGATSMLSVLNLAFYPNERGPYNFSTNLAADGSLNNPRQHWGGMMRRLDTSDFESANIEYVEFWMLDPFIYSAREGKASEHGGDFYINLGEMSEDVLRDGKKFYESGMTVDGTANYVTTQWGKIPQQANVTYAFATTNGSREKQDVGLNGLNDVEERQFPSYQDYINAAQAIVTNAAALDSIKSDPAGDNYHYFRGSDYDRMEASILRRYKYINNPQGNSPDNNTRSEGYDTSYKTSPDVEDINQDYTLNEYEKYYQYHVSIRPEDLVVGQNHIVDKRVGSVKLRNGHSEEATWYQFRIPLREYELKVGGINDFTSVRFMRMFLTGFQHPIVLRFGSFDLVRGEWRVYKQNLDNGAEQGTMLMGAVNIEENNDKSPVNYVLPPGIRRVQDPSQPQLVESNEQAMSLIVNNLASGESKAVYKKATTDLRQYKRIQMFVHANALEQNITNLQDNQLAVFVRLGSDYRNNYYEYEIPLKLTPPRSDYNKYNRVDCEAVWPADNMLNIPLEVFTKLKKERNMAKAQGEASFSRPFSIYDSANPANKVSIVGNPTLGEVKTMVIGVRNLSGETKSGEVWVNELRLKEYNNHGGWAAQGNLNVQLSDFGTLNMQGRYTGEGFGGLEEGVMQRSKDDFKTYTVTTNLELGKFFPDKAQVTAPLYFSVSKDETAPRYNPLDSDMELKDALDAAANKHERDSIRSIVVTQNTNTNFSLSNVRVGIQNKKHPMPYDPANFSFSFSKNHAESSGETTVYEREDNWNTSLNYSWSPVYKDFEPWKKIKNKSKWLDIFRRFGLKWLPQSIQFGSDIQRSYYELQERDMEDLGGSTLPLTFNQQFLWNRDFSIRWDLTKNLHFNFNSATHAEIEEPYTPVNKDLYPDRYEAWKDSVKTSIKNFGTPLDYNQQFSASYQLPLNLIPIFSWVNADAKYTASYNWMRGTEMEDGTSLGNNINNNRNITLNGTFNLEKLYNLVPFLKNANDRFNKNGSPLKATSKNNQKTPNLKGGNPLKPSEDKKDQKDSKDSDPKDALPKNKKSFEKEIELRPDTTITVQHNKKTKRFYVSGRTADGKLIELKYKRVDDNSIIILNKVDSLTKVKVTVTPKQPLDELKWYRTAQTVARGMMMLRSVGVTYSNQYSMSLPGFMPMIGDAFGQKRNNGLFTPGLDFAFGFTGDDYIEKARANDWLLCNDSVATPATTNRTENLQLKATLEPVKNFKIDLNASRQMTTARSIQYMYEGVPTTQTGTFSMTTLSLTSAFEGTGNANNGYYSKSFEKFCKSLDRFAAKVENQYHGSVYPVGTALAGEKFDPANGTVNKYGSDVMIPAFLATYTSMGGEDLDIFPSLSRLLPNWTLKFSGLQRLPWVRDVFKSVNLNHSYKSIYAVGSYSSYATYMEYMNGLGFINDATTQMPLPSSMYNVSAVSINEAFSPLLGIDMTFNSGLTTKLEYKTTRVLSLSMTSVQINESTSHDWVIGFGYKINDFHPFGQKNHRKVKNNKKGDGEGENQQDKKGGAQGGIGPSKVSTANTNNALNVRLDLSYRQQAAISRDIASMTSSASSGNNAFKLSFSADYTLSKLLTLNFFYDFQSNKPLLSSSSYPTTTQDFGFAMKFSLTR